MQQSHLEYKRLANLIFEGNLDICVVVSKGNHYFIFDNKENFVINIKPFYDSYLERGFLNEESYCYALQNFRGGASNLSNDNLQFYLSSLSNNVKTYNWMVEFFQYEVNQVDLVTLYKYLENYLMSGSGDISNSLWSILENRLPKFYINLDRNLFFHTDWQRDFEKQLPEDWSGKASSQFWSLIPDAVQYWVISGMNFWKLYG